MVPSSKSASLRVSVVIPTHNRGEFVERAIGTVLAQSYPPHEVVVVDDASTDDTPRRLEKFGDRIRVLRTEDNVERGAARNLGARHATGEILAFLDSDDEWAPDKLERQLPLIEAGYDACVTGLRIIDHEGRSKGSHYVPRPDAVEQLEYYNPLLGAASSLVIRRVAHLSIGGFPENLELQGSEDWLYLALLRDMDCRFAVVEDPLTRWRAHESNSTADPARLAASMWTAVEWMVERGLLAGPYEGRTRAVTAAAIARAYARSGHARHSFRWWRRVLRHGGPVHAARSGFRCGGALIKHQFSVGR